MYVYLCIVVGFNWNLKLPSHEIISRGMTALYLFSDLPTHYLPSEHFHRTGGLCIVCMLLNPAISLDSTPHKKAGRKKLNTTLTLLSSVVIHKQKWNFPTYTLIFQVGSLIKCYVHWDNWWSIRNYYITGFNAFVVSTRVCSRNIRYYFSCIFITTSGIKGIMADRLWVIYTQTEGV